MRYLALLTCLFLISCGTYKRNENVGIACYPSDVLERDSDDDGVSDKYDRCPETKKSVPVDSHGCPKDTDGDGIYDYKDKELITPSTCQPSDSNGVGNCNR